MREYAAIETDPGLIPAPELLNIAEHIDNQAERIKELEEKLKEEYNRGIKDGLNQVIKL